jgi:hypothetical protein
VLQMPATGHAHDHLIPEASGRRALING